MTPDEVEVSRRNLIAQLRGFSGFGGKVTAEFVRDLVAVLEASKPRYWDGYMDGLRDAKQAGEDNTDGLGNLYRLDWLDAMAKLHDDAFPAMDAAPAGPLEASKPTVVDREALGRAIADHRIECTGPGEVTCRECRDKGWMSWSAFHAHVTDAVLAALYPKATEGKS